MQALKWKQKVKIITGWWLCCCCCYCCCYCCCCWCCCCCCFSWCCCCCCCCCCWFSYSWRRGISGLWILRFKTWTKWKACMELYKHLVSTWNLLFLGRAMTETCQQRRAFWRSIIHFHISASIWTAFKRAWAKGENSECKLHAFIRWNSNTPEAKRWWKIIIYGVVWAAQCSVTSKRKCFIWTNWKVKHKSKESIKAKKLKD